MHRFRKKSDTKRSHLTDDSSDPSPTPSLITSHSSESAPALPALATGLEFRTSLILPDLTRQFAALGRVPSVSESKIRSKLAQQRVHGAKERITEEEEDLMFAALSSIQGIRKRGNSTASELETSVDSQHLEGVNGAKFQTTSTGDHSNYSSDSPSGPESSIYPFASLSSHGSSSSPTKRNSSNLFGSSRFKDAGYMRAARRTRSTSSANSQDSAQGTAASQSENERHSDLPEVAEEHGSSTPPTQEEATQTTQQLSDKEKTPVVRTTRLPPAPRLSNGNILTVAQLQRMSAALERAISSIVENEHDADDDDERILAPHSVPLGGAYLNRRPPTAFNDPSHPIAVSDLNAVLIFLAESEKRRDSKVPKNPEPTQIVSPAPVSRTPGYVPGMNRPMSPRETSGHDSEDYSTTPRATSPVSHQRGGGQVLVPSGRRATNGRPSTAPSRGIGGSDMAQHHDATRTGGLERSVSSGRATDRRLYDQETAEYGGSPYRRYPSTFASKDSNNLSQIGRSYPTMNQASIALSPDRSIQPVAEEDISDPNAKKEGGSEHLDAEAPPQTPFSAGVPYTLQREKPQSQQSMTGPALPESPFINDEYFGNYFPNPATQTWQPDYTPHSGETPSSPGIVMPQPTANGLRGLVADPVLMRSQTPNNLIRSSTPVHLRTATPPVIRTGTPTNYLLQRSPTSNTFNIDYDRSQEKATRRTMSPKPARSHTPSNSSTSAYNPLVHSSIGSSSRSSIESTGSSYHSSDAESNGKHKEVSNWLFDPESKGTVFTGAEKNKPPKNSRNVDSSKDDIDSDSKDDTSESIGDQEDVLELLTGLTKKDLNNIQQKLISAAVTREAEEAIRLSQRRRRPSVQSRELMSSPTPKPVQMMHAEPSVVQSIVAPLVKRVQSPAPEIRQQEVIVAHVSEPPLIVDRPQSNSLEDSSLQVDDPKEFEVPSAPNTPPPPIDLSLTVDQSPRARALAEALFGPEPAPAGLSPSPNTSTTKTPSAEDLQQEVQLKATAATAALKSPTLAVDPTSPLRRKTTKRIDLQKISNPQLVSASVSVDAIPLASPSTASLARAVSPEGKQGGSKFLRRLRGSIRNKPQVVTATHTRDHSSSTTLTTEPASAGTGAAQVVSYNPQNLQTPQVRSVPVITTNGIPATETPMSSPQVTPSSAGIKGFMSRLRPKSRKDELAGSLQPSAFSSSPQINETLSRATSLHLRNRVDSTKSGPNPSRTHIIATPNSDPSPPPTTTTSPGSPDQDAVQKLFNAAKDLGLDPTAIQELLQKSNLQASKPTAFTSLPILEERKVEEPTLGENGQPSSGLSRQPSTKVRIEPTPRARPTREGANPVSGVVRRTIIYPSTSTNSAPVHSRVMGLQRKLSSASKRRPVSVQSQFSARSVHDRVPTPPPPRGIAARRMSEDGHAPPLPSSISSPNGRPSTSAGVIYDDRQHNGTFDGTLEPGHIEDGRALQVVELANGEVIWSVLDTLRSPLGDDFDNDSLSYYFPSRGSYASQYSTPEEPTPSSLRGPSRSMSRAGNDSDTPQPETKVVYSDAKEVARIIGQITNASDQGSLRVGMVTPASTHSSDLPVEEQLDRLLQKVAEAR